MPREGALDSQAVYLISNLGRQRAEKLHTDFIKFEPVKYAEKLVSFNFRFDQYGIQNQMNSIQLYDYFTQECIER